jgi:hypothetical protein
LLLGYAVVPICCDLLRRRKMFRIVPTHPGVCFLKLKLCRVRASHVPSAVQVEYYPNSLAIVRP